MKVQMRAFDDISDFEVLRDTADCDRRDHIRSHRIDYDLFKPYIGEKVTVKRESTSPFSGKKSEIELKGRILSSEHSPMPVFLEKGKRTRVRNVTAGLYDGFHATITIREIKKGW